MECESWQTGVSSKCVQKHYLFQNPNPVKPYSILSVTRSMGSNLPFIKAKEFEKISVSLSAEIA